MTNGKFSRLKEKRDGVMFDAGSSTMNNRIHPWRLLSQTAMPSSAVIVGGSESAAWWGTTGKFCA